jgi:hypothetical protein
LMMLGEAAAALAAFVGVMWPTPINGENDCPAEGCPAPSSGNFGGSPAPTWSKADPGSGTSPAITPTGGACTIECAPPPPPPPPQDAYADGLLKPTRAPDALRDQQTITQLIQDVTNFDRACRVTCVKETTPKPKQGNIAGTTSCTGGACGGGNGNGPATVNLSQYLRDLKDINQPGTPTVTTPTLPETAAGGSGNMRGGGGGNPVASSSSCGPTEGGESFSASTRVLLADGKSVPISSLKVGDRVEAFDTKTGKDQVETITAVLLHHDTDLYNLTVKTDHGTAVIDTTRTHLFWDPYLKQWVAAAKLKKGQHLKTANGATVTVEGGTVPVRHDGWMWDLTVPGNNDHDFYVEVTTADVLVHNEDDPEENVDDCGPDLDALSKSGEKPIGGQGMTKAGASLAQHGEALGYDDLTGGPEAKNMLGQDLLDEILTNPGSTVSTVPTGNFAGGLRFITPDGAGATFDINGVFRYFGYYEP